MQASHSNQPIRVGVGAACGRFEPSACVCQAGYPLGLWVIICVRTDLAGSKLSPTVSSCGGAATDLAHASRLRRCVTVSLRLDFVVRI